jgi:hypothetical protein
MSPSYFQNFLGVSGLASVFVLFLQLVQLHFFRFITLNKPLNQNYAISSEYEGIDFVILFGYSNTHKIETNIEPNHVLSIAGAGVALIGGAINGKKTIVNNKLLAIQKSLRRSRSKPT